MDREKASLLSLSLQLILSLFSVEVKEKQLVAYIKLSVNMEFSNNQKI